MFQRGSACCEAEDARLVCLELLGYSVKGDTERLNVNTSLHLIDTLWGDVSDCCDGHWADVCWVIVSARLMFGYVGVVSLKLSIVSIRVPSLWAIAIHVELVGVVPETTVACPVAVL